MLKIYTISHANSLKEVIIFNSSYFAFIILTQSWKFMLIIYIISHANSLKKDFIFSSNSSHDAFIVLTFLKVCVDNLYYLSCKFFDIVFILSSNSSYNAAIKLTVLKVNVDNLCYLSCKFFDKVFIYLLIHHIMQPLYLQDARKKSSRGFKNLHLSLWNLWNIIVKWTE